MRALLAAGFTACASLLAGQDLDNRRAKLLVIDRDTVRIDTLSVVPGSFSLERDGRPVDAGEYALDPFGAMLIWRGAITGDTLIARYRAMPLLLAGPYRHLDRDRVVSAADDRVDPFKYTPPREGADLLGVPGLNKNGSISRGVLFGNNQDLSVNSTLNLELSGRITDRINVLASITDSNIPIQAEGNTLELQDFDQVFIKLYGDEWDLIAGDFVLQRPKSHFLTYLKKTKGLGFGLRTGERVKQDIGLSAAISKGRFARNAIQGIEGVQGPYRLTGGAGETFIVVLSGTERVYMDGELMTRGQENDYVIDYNTAEIVFTAHRLITKDRRIAVEFQYSDKNYARSLARVSDELRMGATVMRLNVYTEQDHRNQPLQQDLDEEQEQALADAGDDPLAAVVPGADSMAYSNDRVLYARIDSLGHFPVYLYSTSSDSAFFSVTFTNVGAGKGDYLQESFTPNGRVFQWIAPDTLSGALVHRGDHAPVRVLVAPSAQQMVTLGVDHRLGARTSITSEAAFSNTDRNTFSSIDDGDNSGYALRGGIRHMAPLTAGDTATRLVFGAEAEALTREFTVVDRYRPVEFERDWNALATPLDNDQLLATMSAGFVAGRNGAARATLSTFQVRERYEGWRPGLDADLHPGRWDITGEGSLLNTTRPSVSQFLRHKARIARRMRWITIGYRDEHEHNRFRAAGSDTLAPGSYRFYDWEAYVQSPDTFRNKWRLGAGQRYDQALHGNDLQPSTRATHYNAAIDLARDPRNKLAASFTYRRLEVIDTLFSAQRPEDSHLARIDYRVSAWKGVVNGSIFYEFGSGLEPRKEFIYLEVPAGQGLYVWIDYDADGIKDLNEFELASFSYEANYVRVQVPTDDYVRTYSNQFNASVDLRPASAWAQATGLKGFLARFSDLAAYRTDRKTGDDDLAAAVDPFRVDPTDTTLTAFSSSARNTAYFDRTSRTWSIDHTYQNDRGKSLLLNGFESRSREFNQLHVRWNTAPEWTLEATGETGRVASNSDLIEGRTFSIDESSAQPRLTFQPGTAFRASFSAKLTDKRNDDALGGGHAEIRDLGTELRLNAPGKGGIQAAANLVRIAYDGEVNSSLGNEMLEGLKPGDNVTWSLLIQRTLSDHLQIDLTYNGRKSEGTNTVHVGGAQVRAFF